jgi:hypothetical protein
MAITTILSLVGNIQISLPGHTDSPFAWLESIAPPALVLSTAYVLKEQVLESIERRHANERAFQAALTDWRAATANPQENPQWSQFYANALRDALRKANNRRQETLSQMTQDDWCMAVYREIQADLWYVEPEETERPATHVALDHLDDLSSPRRNGSSAVPKVIAVASGAV